MEDLTLNQLLNSKEKELRTLAELREKYKTKEEDIRKRIEEIQNVINYMKLHRRGLSFDDIQTGINFIMNNQNGVGNSSPNGDSLRIQSPNVGRIKKVKVKIAGKKSEEQMQKEEPKSIYEKAYEEMVRRNGTISEWLKNPFILQGIAQDEVDGISFENDNGCTVKKNVFKKITENFTGKLIGKLQFLKVKIKSFVNFVRKKITVKHKTDNISVTRTKEGDKSFVAKVYIRRRQPAKKNVHPQKVVDISRRQMSL